MSTKTAERWYRWSFNSNSGTEWHYSFGSRDVAEYALEHYMTNHVPHSAHYRGGKVQAIKLPPTSWLFMERQRALARCKEARTYADFIHSQILAPAKRATLSQRKGAK